MATPAAPSRLSAVLCLLSAGLVGCGAGPGVTSPSAPPVTAIRFASSTDLLFIGSASRFQAEAVFTGGVVQPVAAQWTSSDPLVMAIEGNGNVLAISNGTSTITALYQGRSATLSVRAAPDFRGSWVGTLTIEGCARDASFPVVTFCSALLSSPARPLRLTLQQERLDSNGTLSIFDADGSVSGIVDSAGSLLLQGSMNVTSGSTNLAVTVAGWRASMAQAGQLSGRFSTQWTASGSNGSGFMEATFVLTRSP
jgi:hypothetical protein